MVAKILLSLYLAVAGLYIAVVPNIPAKKTT